MYINVQRHAKLVSFIRDSVVCGVDPVQRQGI
jgi:hypothetical protein